MRSISPSRVVLIRGSNLQVFQLSGIEMVIMMSVLHPIRFWFPIRMNQDHLVGLVLRVILQHKLESLDAYKIRNPMHVVAEVAPECVILNGNVTNVLEILLGKCVYQCPSAEYALLIGEPAEGESVN